MRFALLGDHPDGLDMAGALVDSGRHQVSACTARLDETIRRRLGSPHFISDLEEVLADPAIEAVIVAGHSSVRPAQLRRALQSERHVLCVHPADDTPDVGYEAAMLQRDTGYVLFPLLPESLHPAFDQLAQFIEGFQQAQVSELVQPGPGPAGAITPQPAQAPPARSAVGAFRLLKFERAVTGEVLDNTHSPGLNPALPGWDVLRRLGGELSEVSSFTDGEELTAGLPVLLAGRFAKGGLFQVTLLPGQPEAYWRLAVAGTADQAELMFPQGWNGPAILELRDQVGQRREEYHHPFDPWPALVEAFEQAAGCLASAETCAEGTGPSGRAARLSWQDEIRSLELDDAARRSVERRRVNLMEYQEASEEVGFKGTMTLVGCGLLWAVLLLLIVSYWIPWMGWLILPLLLLFIALQFLRYVIPATPTKKEGR